MAGGRPKIKLTDLRPDWKEVALELGKVGGSAVETRAKLDICQSTWERLIKEEEEFSLTIKRASDLCEAWWIENGRTNLKDKDFSYTGWYMQMKNRFKWKDRHDLTTDDKEFKPVERVIVEVVTKLDEA